jgi:hypothetical protein
MKMGDLQHIDTGHKILIPLRFTASLFETYFCMVCCIVTVTPSQVCIGIAEWLWLQYHAGPETYSKPSLHARVALFISVNKLTTEGVFCLSRLFRLMIMKCWMTLSSVWRRYERVSCSAWSRGRPSPQTIQLSVQLAVFESRRPDCITAVLPQ